MTEVFDTSVYPDTEAPDALLTDEDKADYLQRICGAFDFGIPPEMSTVEMFRGWKDIFDRYPLPSSPGYHALRTWFRWNQIERQPYLGLATWQIQDQREGREDPCIDMV